MTAKQQSKPSAAPSAIKPAGHYRIMDIDQCKPNTWNPNRQAPAMYDRELASLRKFGFVVPIIVRVADGADPEKEEREIVDGEHRWRAAKQLRMKKIPVYDVGVISREDAMQLTVALNEIKGRADAINLGEVIAELQQTVNLEEPAKVFPYSPKEMQALIELLEHDSEEADFGKLKLTKEMIESRVAFVLSLTPSQLQVVTQAFDKALGLRAKTPNDRGFAMELVAADYLSGAAPEKVDKVISHAVMEICREFLGHDAPE